MSHAHTQKNLSHITEKKNDLVPKQEFANPAPFSRCAKNLDTQVLKSSAVSAAKIEEFFSK